MEPHYYYSTLNKRSPSKRTSPAPRRTGSQPELMLRPYAKTLHRAASCSSPRCQHLEPRAAAGTEGGLVPAGKALPHPREV